MIENELKIFVDGLGNFFDLFTGKEAIVGTPFLIDDVNQYLEEHTGIIRISGKHKGIVLFTASEPLLKNILWAMKILDSGKGNLEDLVGEIGNVVSGNARTEFGNEFMISPPIYINGELSEESDAIPMSSFVIPMNWKSQTANLIINLH